MSNRLREAVHVAQEVKAECVEDNIFNGAAALAFYLTLAMFPALILVMGVIPYLPVPRVDQAIMDLLGQVMPAEAYQMVSKVINDVMANRSGGVVSFGAIGTLWAASTGMYAIMQQLNVTFDVQEGRPFLRARGVALALSFMFGALLLLSFSMIVLGGVVQDWLIDRYSLDGVRPFFSTLRWVIILASIVLAFSLMYWLAPNIERSRFRFITIGGAVGTVLLLVGSAGFALYVRYLANYDSVYGGIGAVIALMLWLYLAGLSLLIGSEVDAVLQRRSSGRTAPAAAARPPSLAALPPGDGRSRIVVTTSSYPRNRS